MRITNLGHASFLIEGEEVSFVIDPYEDNSVPCLTLPRVKANFAFKSHDHSDHNALDLVEIIPSKATLDYRTIIVPHDKNGGEMRGLNKIHIFDIDGYEIIHMGDTGCIPSDAVLEELKNADVLLGPINGFFTISSEELRDICEVIKPRLVIPMHYYKKEDNSGYPDGNQIDTFKFLYPNALEVNDYSIELSDELLNKGALIFRFALQEEL